MNTQAKVILGLAGVILLAGIGLVILGTRPPPEPTFKGSVKDLLPDAELVARSGWTVQYLSIANTPEEKAKVDELLNYDDAVYVTYARSDVRISIYVAHWLYGKMQHRLVAGHTPDVCWVGAGWQIVHVDRLSIASGSSSSVPAEIDDMVRSNRPSVPLDVTLSRLARYIGSDNRHVKLPEAEYRVMKRSDVVEYVAFWHLLNRESMNYGTQGAAPWYAIFTDLLQRKLDQKPEQLFIRISSNQPLG